MNSKTHLLYLLQVRQEQETSIINIFLDNGVSFHPDIEVSTTDQIIPLIIHNLGIAFYPRKLAQPYLDKGEVYEILLIQSLPHRKVCLVKDPNKSQKHCL